jgi:pimeloyl-ACP methyl ester carboxylesterase
VLPVQGKIQYRGTRNGNIFACEQFFETGSVLVNLVRKNYLGDLLPFFNVASFDCSGSGLSEGNYVTLGYCEKEDLRSVIKHLKRDFGLRNFILWGRSMGAVTALLYAAKYQDVLTLISDNAFSDL